MAGRPAPPDLVAWAAHFSIEDALPLLLHEGFDTPFVIPQIEEAYGLDEEDWNVQLRRWLFAVQDIGLARHQTRRPLDENETCY